MADIERKLGIRIQMLRKARGFTQAELAEKTNLSENFIGSVERGTRSPSIQSLYKIAKALKVRIKELFDIPERGYYPDNHEDALIKLEGLIREGNTEDVEMILDITKRILSGKKKE